LLALASSLPNIAALAYKMFHYLVEDPKFIPTILFAFGSGIIWLIILSFGLKVPLTITFPSKVIVYKAVSFLAVMVVFPSLVIPIVLLVDILIGWLLLLSKPFIGISYNLPLIYILKVPDF